MKSQFELTIDDTRTRLTNPLEKAAFQAFCAGADELSKRVACYRCQHPTIGIFFHRQHDVSKLAESDWSCSVMSCGKFASFAQPEHVTQHGLPVDQHQLFVCSGAIETPKDEVTGHE